MQTVTICPITGIFVGTNTGGERLMKSLNAEAFLMKASPPKPTAKPKPTASISTAKPAKRILFFKKPVAGKPHGR